MQYCHIVYVRFKLGLEAPKYFGSSLFWQLATKLVVEGSTAQINALARLIRPCPIFHGECAHARTLLPTRSDIQRADLPMIMKFAAST